MACKRSRVRLSYSPLLKIKELQTTVTPNFLTSLTQFAPIYKNRHKKNPAAKTDDGIIIMQLRLKIY
jgi:hypothetical protein